MKNKKLHFIELPISFESIINVSEIKKGAHGVMVIVVGNGHGETSSNPEQDGLHFT